MNIPCGFYLSEETSLKLKMISKKYDIRQTHLVEEALVLVIYLIEKYGLSNLYNITEFFKHFSREKK